MKVLFINNFHYNRGGAERAYFDTAAILKSHGHEVAFFSMQDPKNRPTEWSKYFVDNVDYNSEENSLWQKIKMVQRLIFNFQAKKNLEKLILDFRPDVAHLHNIYHQLSPSVIYALKKYNVPMTMTLHDYKLISPNYNLFLRGKIWEKKSLFSCVKDRCVKNSYIKSAVCALEKLIHDALGSYEEIDAFISPSNFLIEKFEEFDFKKEIKWIPNPILDSFLKNKIENKNSGPLVYYGRLSQEKGIYIAIRAMENCEEELQIVGDGPEKNNLVELTKKLGLESRIEFLGFKSGQDLENILSATKAIIIPSIWYENMPYAAVESLAMGKIVIASRVGGIPDLICDKENGFLFEPGNKQNLAEKIKKLENFDLEKISRQAKESVVKFNSENYYKKIIEIYKKI